MENKEKDLQTEWYKLHKKLVDEIIKFCSDNGINEADGFGMDADCLSSSIEGREWGGGTDSSFTLFDKNNNVILCSI